MHRARVPTIVLTLLAALGCSPIRSSATAPSPAAEPSRVELGGGDVLYVIDGRRLPHAPRDSTVPPEVRALDPADIVSIQVLKGTEALRRYGHEGENGVVLISTRRKG